MREGKKELVLKARICPEDMEKLVSILASKLGENSPAIHDVLGNVPEGAADSIVFDIELA